MTITAYQVERMLALLNQLRVLAEAPAGSVSRDVSKGKPGGKPPPAVHSLFDQWAAKFAECETDAQLELQLMLAEADLRAVRFHRDKGLRQYDEEEMTERMLGFEGRDPREVAILCGPTVRESAVRRTRMQHGRNPDTGEADIRFLNRDHEEKALAEVLRKEGLSVRSIAIRLSVTKSTVDRWLRAKSEAA
jgi:hypothetical protein